MEAKTSVIIYYLVLTNFLINCNVFESLIFSLESIEAYINDLHVEGSNKPKANYLTRTNTVFFGHKNNLLSKRNRLSKQMDDTTNYTNNKTVEFLELVRNSRASKHLDEEYLSKKAERLKENLIHHVSNKSKGAYALIVEAIERMKHKLNMLTVSPQYLDPNNTNLDIKSLYKYNLEKEILNKLQQKLRETSNPKKTHIKHPLQNRIKMKIKPMMTENFRKENAGEIIISNDEIDKEGPNHIAVEVLHKDVDDLQDNDIDGSRHTDVDKPQYEHVDNTQYKDVNKPDVDTPRDQDMETPRYKGVDSPQYNDMANSRYKDLDKSQYKDINKSQYKDMEKSQYKDLDKDTRTKNDSKMVQDIEIEAERLRQKLIEKINDKTNYTKKNIYLLLMEAVDEIKNTSRKPGKYNQNGKPIDKESEENIYTMIMEAFEKDKHINGSKLPNLSEKQSGSDHLIDKRPKPYIDNDSRFSLFHRDDPKPTVILKSPRLDLVYTATIPTVLVLFFLTVIIFFLIRPGGYLCKLCSRRTECNCDDKKTC